MAFEENVFVNCPFDRQFLPLLRPLLFTITYLGLRPRIALEAMDAGQGRLDKIVRLIRESKFGIHDLSRIEAALSDLSGSDIESHGNEPYRVIGIVRNWLKNVCQIEAAGPAKIASAFSDFMAHNYDVLKAKGFSPQDIEGLPVPELIEGMERWVADNKGP